MENIYERLRNPKFSTFIYTKKEGENRATDAAQTVAKKLKSGKHDISNSKTVLLQIASGDSEITIDEIGIISDSLQDLNKHLSIVMSVLEKDLGNAIEVKVIFTSLEIPKDLDADLVFGSKPEFTKSIPLYLLEDDYTVSEISEMVSFLSDIYSDIGGDKLKIRGLQYIEVEHLEPILQ